MNHASYVDPIMLIAGLKEDFGYVGKAELSGRFIWRVLFRRFGVEFVERFDAQRGVEDTARVLNVVQQGQAVVFFPEGTFRREPGLRPFRMGAFVVAAQAGVPLVPLAIRGTRSILRDGQWFPRRGPIYITVGEPIEPQGKDWASAITLRNEARVQILRFCGEPDVAENIVPDL
jgi:1-acyl-sn-glycerol-3-phosphate acyltransferase